MTGAQALDFRLGSEKLETSSCLKKIHSSFREVVTFLETDRELYNDIATSEKFIREFDFHKL
jgi:histidine ammonia-lyase